METEILNIGSFDPNAPQTTTVDKPATIKGNEITVNIDVPDVAQMIVKNKVPILRLIMSDGTGPALQRDMQVSFVLPKSAEVQSNNTLAEPVKSALLEVTKKVEGNGKGIEWKKLLASGFSLFVKAALPIP